MKITTWAVAGLAMASLAAAAPGGSAPAVTHAPPHIRHVFIIILENQAFETTFAAGTPAPFLGHTLVARGAVLPNYFGIGHMSLDNYIALISGQPPNEATQLDCPEYTPFQLTQPTLDANGVARGSGCIYPPLVKTIGDQLEGAGLSWRAYMEDLGNNPTRDGGPCGHPTVGAQDPTETAKPDPHDQYAMWHNPFVFFQTVIADSAHCTTHVVSLSGLAADLASPARTPNYAFITPNLCDDAHDEPCVDGSAGGLAAADAFLRHWVPIITQSRAFKTDGALIITFDESASATAPDTSSACCGERGLPGAPHPPGGSGPGGGRVGAVLLSPFIKPGTVSTAAYNHYALLRWVEDTFGLPHLGYAAADGLRPFGTDVFTGARPPS
jgi:hypothetical protein